MGSSKADEVASRKYFQENGTLHNKLDIKKAPALEKAEAFFVEQAKHESLSPRAKEINTDGLKQMHKGDRSKFCVSEFFTRLLYHPVAPGSEWIIA